MDFDLSDMYRQTADVFFTILNAVIACIYIILIFPGYWLKNSLLFLEGQVIHSGNMQSGNITVIFVFVVLGSFLLTHFSNWFEHVFLPKASFPVIKFGYLITKHFSDIAAIYVKNKGHWGFKDAILEGYEKITSAEHGESIIMRQLSVYQQRLRFYTSYAGTFKLGGYLCLINGLYRFIWYLDVRSCFYYVLLSVISTTLWLITENLIGKTFWEMFDKYWSHQNDDGVKIKGDLNRIFNKLHSKYSLKTDLSDFDRMINDIKTSQNINWGHTVTSILARIKRFFDQDHS